MGRKVRAAVAIGVLLHAAPVLAGGTIQVGLAGLALPASNACTVTVRTGTYMSRPVVACETNESFFLNFYNLPDASKTYDITVAWRTESTNTATGVVWTIGCGAHTDGTADDSPNISQSTAATSEANLGQRLMNLDTLGSAIALTNLTGVSQCSGSACAGVPVTCKVTATTCISGAECDYIGMSIAATDS